MLPAIRHDHASFDPAVPRPLPPPDTPLSGEPQIRGADSGACFGQQWALCLRVGKYAPALMGRGLAALKKGVGAAVPSLGQRRGLQAPALALALALGALLPACADPGASQKERAAKARQMMAERCKTAGEKIHRTVSGVEGILLMKLRPERSNTDDQFALTDPYGNDVGGDGYISTFLTGRFQTSRAGATIQPPRPSYLHVEAIDPTDGRRYRYSGAMRDVVHKSSRLIGGDGSSFTTRDFVLDKIPAPGEKPRYGVTYEDISTPEEREYWIAGSSLEVVDLQTGETLAERIGYMVDLMQGDRRNGRSPWLGAASFACPAFEGRPAFVGQRQQTRRFVFKVLIPIQGEKQ